MSVRPALRPVMRTLAAAAAVTGLVVATSAPAGAVASTKPETSVWGTNGRVHSIVETPNAVYIAGAFTKLIGPGGQALDRKNLAALNPSTGAPLSWSPQPNQSVLDLGLSPDGKTLYAGGTFTRLGSVDRQRTAAWTVSTGALTGFEAKADSAVEAIAVSGSAVYFGGRFSNVNGTNRPNFAATTLSGSLLGGFTGASGRVRDIKISSDGSKIVVGGGFATINGSGASPHLAVLSPSGSVASMPSALPYEVYDTFITSSQIFVAMGGPGGRVYALNSSTRQQQWMTLTNGDVYAVAAYNGSLYVGGHFNTIENSMSSHFGVLNTSNGNRQSWFVKMNSALGVFAANVYDGHLTLGGDFTLIDGKSINRVARFDGA